MYLPDNTLCTDLLSRLYFLITSFIEGNSSINGSIITIRYKRYVEHITKEGKDESWWDYNNYTEVELLDYITFVFNTINNNK